VSECVKATFLLTPIIFVTLGGDLVYTYKLRGVVVQGISYEEISAGAWRTCRDILVKGV
jgi:hypothetical protein